MGCSYRRLDTCGDSSWGSYSLGWLLASGMRTTELLENRSQSDSFHPAPRFDKAYYLDKPHILTVLAPKVKPSTPRGSGGDSPRGGGIFFLSISPVEFHLPQDQHQTWYKVFYQNFPSPSSLETETNFFFQASVSGNFTFAFIKRNGNTQTFHFH